MGNLIINDNLFLRQYEVEIEDDLAIIEYALQDRKIFLTKLVIPSSNKDENFEETFIREVFEIIKEKNIMVNSIHHQGIDKLGEDLKITAKSNDGVIEGIETTNEWNAIGIQWHPENMVKDTYSNLIFDWLNS